MFTKVSPVHKKLTNKNYHTHAHLLNKGQTLVLNANQHIAGKIVNAVLNQGRNFICTGCGKLMMELENYAGRLTCNKECHKRAQGNSFRGRKRPEHSKIMKIKTRQLIKEGKLWGKDHRLNHAVHLKNLNSTIGKGTPGRKALVEKRESLEAVRERLLKISVRGPYFYGLSYTNHAFFDQSSLSKLSFDKVPTLTNKELRFYKTEMNSLKSIVAMERNPNMGATAFYKRLTINNLKSNKSAKQVTVRSSLEYDFVRWLEKNKIPWLYEWVKLPLGLGRSYLPDFKVWFGEDVWVVETKGVYISRDNLPFSFKKENIAAAWCRTRDYGFVVLSASQIGREGSKINLSEWVDLTGLSDRRISTWLKQNIPGGKNANN